MSPALSPGSRAEQHSNHSLRAALLWELPEKLMVRRARAGGRQGQGALGWKGCLRVHETGVLEDEEKVLDPSLTCVALDVMSPLWVSVSPMVKWECVLNGQQDSVCTLSLGQ